MLPQAGQPVAANPFWQIAVDFLPFVLRLYTYPRQLVRSLNWDSPVTLSRIAFYTLLGLAILVLAFSDNQRLADEARPPLSSFKGVVMRAHDTSWDWLSPVYHAFRLEQGEAKRLWDTLLTSGFMLYTLLASLIGLAVIVRLRMWRFGLGYNHALGTGLLAWLAGTSCIALSLVPLFELFICRECFVRLSLFILLNVAGWTYAGYYTLADLGERPRNVLVHLLWSAGYGLVQYVLAYVVFFALIVAIIPM